MSAETARLSVTPAPIGRPGGPGLFHVKGLGLPPYIQNIRNALMRDGMEEGRATATAIATCKRWAAGIGKVSPEVRAAAAKALAEWEADRAKAHSLSSPVRNAVDLAVVATPAGAQFFGVPIGSPIQAKAVQPSTPTGSKATAPTPTANAAQVPPPPPPTNVSVAQALKSMPTGQLIQAAALASQLNQNVPLNAHITMAIQTEMQQRGFAGNTSGGTGITSTVNSGSFSLTPRAIQQQQNIEQAAKAREQQQTQQATLRSQAQAASDARKAQALQARIDAQKAAANLRTQKAAAAAAKRAATAKKKAVPKKKAAKPGVVKVANASSFVRTGTPYGLAQESEMIRSDRVRQRVVELAGAMMTSDSMTSKPGYTPSGGSPNAALRKQAVKKGGAMSGGSFPLIGPDGKPSRSLGVKAVRMAQLSKNPTAARKFLMSKFRAYGWSDLIPSNWNSDGTIDMGKA